MILKGLLDLWLRDPSFRKLTEQFGSGLQTNVSGLDGTAKSFFMAGLVYHLNRPALIVTADAARAEKIYEDLAAFFPSEQVNLLPAREMFMDAGVLTQSMEQRQQRMVFHEWLYHRKKGIYVAPVAALMSRVIPPDKWRGPAINLRSGKQIDRDLLLHNLVDLGYERVPKIENKGQFSSRGEIIDIFPPGWEQPLRAELFDRNIDSLRLFDPQTQRSTRQLDGAVILPAYELILPAAQFRANEPRLRRDLDQAVSRLRFKGDLEAAAKLKTGVEQQLHHLAQRGGLDNHASCFSYFYEQGSSLIHYLAENTVLMLDEPAVIKDSGSTLHRDLKDYCSNMFLQGALLPGQVEHVWETEELFNRPGLNYLAFTLFPGSTGGLSITDEIRLEAKGASFYHGQWELLKNDCFRWIKQGYQVCILADNRERGERLLKTLLDNDIPVRNNMEGAWLADLAVSAQMVAATLEQGYVVPSLQLAVLTEQNLIPRQRKRKRLTRREGLNLRDYRELNPGDYVVHEQHGIGKYLGLSTLEIGGVLRDYLLVKYSGTDKLYIPVDQIALIQKYVSPEGKAPRLHSLGSGEWHRLKSKVDSSVQELARELLSLYAARQATVGYAFNPDHPWQMEFETRFPYEETPDQLQAIAEVKADLEKLQPMDRLICGDVGYGKTEVALRAAFKVAMEGKQVVILVPTTVLAHQHFRTFQERLKDFPLRVAQLSRFVSPADQKELLKDLSRGRIDIVIGTHRLLSADVRIHDLGLLIIDEEQRFGVRHKEKLKKLRLDVDVLAMTATPIPRTMYLSLVGARDLSVIETPPENRYPVQTYVAEYTESLIWEAIQRELNRDGQIYFVFNRVEGIEGMAKKIRALFPGVSVAVGHGQMSEIALELVMSEFLEGRTKILVSTTIIEAGLDIANVNTLIVYEAERFGLAQLYQLRGRVGRSDRVAYAYLTYKKEKIISDASRKRLQAIKEFTELGAGFQVALKDLEIRGAGNILGAEQHGFMVAVGFDLYVRLLEKAVAELKNEKKDPKPALRLDLPLNAHLPSSYIPKQDQKIDLYQRIYTAGNEAELKSIEEELHDCYGSPPAPAKNLLHAAALRVAAQELSIELIQMRQKIMVIQFGRRLNLNSNELWAALDLLKGKAVLSAVKSLAVKVVIDGPLEEMIPDLILFLKMLKERTHPQQDNNDPGLAFGRGNL